MLHLTRQLVVFSVVFSAFLFSCFQEQCFSFNYLVQPLDLQHWRVAQKAEKSTLSFASSVKFGKQVNQLSVLVSTDFSGINTYEEIQKATWKAIKGIKLADSDQLQESGAIDLSGFVKSGQPFYIAFRYTGEVSGERPTQRTWQISNIKVSEKPVSFHLINSPTNDEKTGWVKFSSGIIFRPAATLKKSEGWAVSAVQQ